MPTQVKRPHGFRDLFLYIVVGVAIAALAILLGVHKAKTGHSFKETISIVGVLFLGGCGTAFLLLRGRVGKAIRAGRRKPLTR
jgi:hypothetical protein